MTPEQALNSIAGQCSKKEMCSKDVRLKLKKWDISEKEILKIISFLKEHKFIDDERFACIYAEDKFRFNHWGKQKIGMMLQQKGIPSEMIAVALANISIDHYEESCVNLLRQKAGTLSTSDYYQLKARLARFALSRGFDFDTINKSITRLLTEK